MCSSGVSFQFSGCPCCPTSSTSQETQGIDYYRQLVASINDTNGFNQTVAACMNNTNNNNINNDNLNAPCLNNNTTTTGDENNCEWRKGSRCCNDPSLKSCWRRPNCFYLAKPTTYRCSYG